MFQILWCVVTDAHTQSPNFLAISSKEYLSLMLCLKWKIYKTYFLLLPFYIDCSCPFKMQNMCEKDLFEILRTGRSMHRIYFIRNINSNFLSPFPFNLLSNWKKQNKSRIFAPCALALHASGDRTLAIFLKIGTMQNCWVKCTLFVKI